jgi:protein-tyrosine kinase
MTEISQYVEVEQIYAQTLGSGFRTLTIAAPNSSSGCTSIACALAFRHSAIGQSVLLIDANLRSPTIDQKFNLKRTRWPENAVSLNSHLQPLMPRVTALTANLDGAELIKTHKYIGGLIEHFKHSFDVIIFDTSPLNAINKNNISADTIASLTDATLIVIKGGETTETELRQARAKLTTRVNLVGAVINDQHNPKLSDELIRETNRMAHKFPRLANKLKQLIAQSHFLNIAT